MRAGRRSRTWRRLGLSVAGVGLALGLLELGLQGIAYWQWRSRRVEAKLRSGTPVVLCVGDSFTYGMGATTQANTYPARLEAHLGGKAQVINGAWVGQTSADVLRRLPGQLERYRPKIVCVLTGNNDFGWPTAVLPEQAEAADSDAFPIKLRLGVLAHAIAQRVRGGGSIYDHNPGSAPFIGAWHLAGHEIRIEPNGNMLVNFGVEASDAFVYGLAMRWQLGEAGLELQLPDGREFTSQWRVLGDQLVLTLPDVPTPLAFARGAAPRPTRADCAARAAQLRARYEAGDHKIGVETVSALLQSGDLDGGLQFCIRLQDDGVRLPNGTPFLLASGDPEQHVHLQAALTKTLDDPRVLGPLRAMLLRARYFALRGPDRHRALLSLLEAELLLTDAIFTTTNLHRAPFSPAEVAQALDELGVDAAQRERLSAMSASPSVDTESRGAVLTEHLHRIVRACRDANAEPVLLTYPFHAPDYEAVLAEVALTTAAPLVPVRRAFDDLLTTMRWEELFVVDGHCNDRGYDELGREVAKRVTGLLDGSH